MKEITSPFHRRKFIKAFTVATAYSSLLGKSWIETFAAEIKPLAATTLGQLRVKLSTFPALLSESGSIRLGLNPLKSTLLPDGTFYPVVINRGPNATFYALNSKCTHESCAVDPMDSFSNRITCPCHGSVYAIDGRRLIGPAPSSLTKYSVTFDGKDTLTIQIPNLGYSITNSAVQSAANGTPRLRLDFKMFRNVDYEIQFRESLEADPAPVPFATTQDGTTDQTVFSAAANGTASLFVDRKSASGFYTVAIRVAEI